VRGKRPPGPTDWLFGLRLLGRLRRDLLGFATELRDRYGDLVLVRFGPIRAFFVNHPDLIRDVLVSHAARFRKLPRQMRVLARVNGNSVVVTEGDFWLRQRRLVQPAFHPRRFDRYAEAVVADTARMLQRWPAAGVVDIAEEMTRLTLAVVARTFFDLELSDQADHLAEQVRVLSEGLVRQFNALVPLPDWLPLPGRRRWRRALQVVDSLIGETIRQRRATGEDRGDLLSMLLLASDEEGDRTGLTDRQARDEALALFLAGHDSTAAALTWLWYLLARHPEVQARLAAEVRQVLGERPATWQDVPRLSYTKMVLEESLRLYPPNVALFVRQALADVEVGGFVIPRGAWVFIFPYVVHRDGRFFPQPERFDPERFAPDRQASRPAYAYFPFGGGPHLCLGSPFALMLFTLVAATVVQQFRLTLAPGQGPVEPELHIAIRPRGGLRLALSRAELPRRPQV
jgi:cytochrome P450